ncbi:hypothetical protein DD606_24795 [Enterobacter cloacae complex sp. GF14B]|nr:hypothetical protein DD606_24795 [Enterobacter cloacae complex sp. GF14B]
MHENIAYSLSELDGTEAKVPIAGKMIKVFKSREDRDPEEEKNTGEDQSEDEALESSSEEESKEDVQEV